MILEINENGKQIAKIEIIETETGNYMYKAKNAKVYSPGKEQGEYGFSDLFEIDIERRISYEEVDINDKDTIKAYFPKDKVGNEMFECVQSVPPRFRKDALDVFCDADDREMWDMRTVDKAWCYFLDDIVPEMTDKEKKEYHFG